MDYPQILAPVLNFLQCPTPQAWIDKARDPANLPLLLTDHMVCELKAAQTALLLVRKYVADESGADALLDWLKPYEQFTFRDGPEPDFIALHRQIGKSVMPNDGHELHAFHQRRRRTDPAPADPYFPAGCSGYPDDCMGKYPSGRTRHAGRSF